MREDFNNWKIDPDYFVKRDLLVGRRTGTRRPCAGEIFTARLSMKGCRVLNSAVYCRYCCTAFPKLLATPILLEQSHDGPMSDPGIEALSRKANEEQAACPVTLVVSGNMVTGHIVGQETFEADTTRMVEMAQEQSDAEDDAVRAMGGLISAMLNEVKGADESGEYVHVSVQEVMTGAEAIHLGGSVFRFRTSEIEGYTIGTVETREA